MIPSETIALKKAASERQPISTVAALHTTSLCQNKKIQNWIMYTNDCFGVWVLVMNSSTNSTWNNILLKVIHHVPKTFRS